MLFKQGNLTIEVRKLRDENGDVRYLYSEYDENDCLVYEHLIARGTVEKFYPEAL